MANFNYLIHIQYLGFRFHGWQKQPGLKTVHQMVDKTLEYVFEDQPFKTLGASRTDSKVSANHGAFQLFLNFEIEQLSFLKKFNAYLPNDITAIGIEKVTSDFNIIQTPRIKSYQYLFCFGEKPHPFCTPLITYFKGDLDIELMKQGAKLFEGEHNFVRYCSKPKPNTNFKRTVNLSEIVANKEYTANFFPETSYILNLESAGFLRYQVRFIMGQLVKLGEHGISLEEISESLKGDDTSPLREIVPGSGLILNKIKF